MWKPELLSICQPKTLRTSAHIIPQRPVWHGGSKWGLRKIFQGQETTRGSKGGGDESVKCQSQSPWLITEWISMAALAPLKIISRPAYVIISAFARDYYQFWVNRLTALACVLKMSRPTKMHRIHQVESAGRFSRKSVKRSTHLINLQSSM